LGDTERKGISALVDLSTFIITVFCLADDELEGNPSGAIAVLSLSSPTQRS